MSGSCEYGNESSGSIKGVNRPSNWAVTSVLKNECVIGLVVTKNTAVIESRAILTGNESVAHGEGVGTVTREWYYGKVCCYYYCFYRHKYSILICYRPINVLQAIPTSTLPNLSPYGIWR